MNCLHYFLQNYCDCCTPSKVHYKTDMYLAEVFSFQGTESTKSVIYSN